MPKSQSGFAPIVIIAVVALVAAVGGYFVLGKGGGGSVPGLPGGIGLNPNCKYNDPDLCKFINNFKDLKTYSIKSTTTAKSQPKMENLLELSGDDKFHMVTSENAKENYNVITIGDTTYTKDYSDNKWWKQVAPKQKEENTKIKDEVDVKDTVEEDKTTYKKIGMEACGSLQCFKYQVISPDMTDITEYIFFDNNQYMLRKTREEVKDGTVSEADYAYSGVNIQVPSPVKEAKPGQIITPTGAVPGVSEKDLEEWQKAAQQVQNQTPQAPAAPAAAEENPAPVDNSGGE
ncbi:MAG: hypothetical protein M1142_03465 [Patescibacteria group bacterium]|nr:hypothetical protein [Patescibacteria group bacterium]